MISTLITSHNCIPSIGQYYVTNHIRQWSRTTHRCVDEDLGTATKIPARAAGQLGPMPSLTMLPALRWSFYSSSWWVIPNVEKRGVRGT